MTNVQFNHSFQFFKVFLNDTTSRLHTRDLRKYLFCSVCTNFVIKISIYQVAGLHDVFNFKIILRLGSQSVNPNN